MKSVSNTYKTLRNQSGSYYNVRVLQGNNVYGMDVLKSCKITQAVYDGDGPQIGHTYSAQCSLSLLAESTVWPRMAAFEVQVQLSSATGQTLSEWLSMGTYYTDERSQSKSGVLSVVGFDGMLLLEQSWTDKISQVPTEWPITAYAAGQLLQEATGIQIDSRTELNNDTPFVGLDTTSTAREVYNTIASGHGGNWIMTSEGKLLLSRLTNSGNTDGATAQTNTYTLYLTTENGTVITDTSGGGIIVMQATSLGTMAVTLDVGAELDEITGVALTDEAGTVASAGNTNGYVLTGNCNYCDSDVANLALRGVYGYKFRPFSASGVILDPVVEPGDLVILDDLGFQIITIDWSLGRMITATISAPFEAEVDHEYVVQSEAARALQRALAADTDVEGRVHSYITQTAEQIEQGVAARYATKTDLVTTESKITQTAESITLEVNEKIENLQDQIDGVVDYWTGSGVPTLSNYPANQWTTATLKSEHIGDVYTDTNTEYVYRFSYDSGTGTYSWTQLADNAITQALAAATEAQATANATANLLQNSYSTTVDMNSAINQKATEINQNVSQTYTTKTDVEEYTTGVLSGYSTTEDMNSAINQKAREIDLSVSRNFAAKSYVNAATDGIYSLEAPYTYSSGSAIFQAVVYKNSKDVTDDMTEYQFSWWLFTEDTDGPQFKQYGKSFSVSASDVGYGGAIILKFEVPGEAEVLYTHNGYYLTTHENAQIEVVPLKSTLSVTNVMYQPNVLKNAFAGIDISLEGVTIGYKNYTDTKLGDYATTKSMEAAISVSEEGIIETLHSEYVTNATAISAEKLWYLVTSASSGVTRNTSGWTDNIAQATLTATNKYLWTYIEYTKADNSKTYSTPVITGVYGDKGDKGDTGVGINSVTEYYCRSTSNTTAPSSGWTTNTTATNATITSTYKYLWNYEQIAYTNGTSFNTTPAVIGVYGNTGSTGVGISSVTEHYLASTSSSGVTTSTSGWSTSIQTITATKKYLWNYETVTYSDNTTSDTSPVIIGTYGDKGDKGDTGKGISSITEYYARNNSTTAPSDESFGNSVLAPTANQRYLWNYEKVTYTDSTYFTSDKHIIAVYGATGSSGKGISSITEYYAISNSTTAPADSSFSTAVSSPTSSNKYLWNYEVVTYTDSTTEKTSKRIIGTYGEKGDSITVSSIKYAVGTSGTTAPSSGWQSTVPSASQGQWLWVRTTYSDNTTADTCSYQGTDGEDGTSVTVQSATKTGGVTTVVLVDSDGQTSTLTISDGTDGASGTPGANGYVHTAWANSANGQTDFSTTVSTNKKYLGVYTDNTAADSTSPSAYSWSLIKGADGADGSDGVGVVSLIPLYFASTQNTTAPAAPTLPVTTNTEVYNAWTKFLPTLTETYKYLWTCYQTEYSDGTYETPNVILEGAISSLSSRVVEVERRTTDEGIIQTVKESNEFASPTYVEEITSGIYVLQTPWKWTNGSVTVSPVVYRGGVDVTSSQDAKQFAWFIVTENTDGKQFRSYGKTFTISAEAMGYGGTVVCEYYALGEVSNLTTHNSGIITYDSNSAHKVEVQPVSATLSAEISVFSPEYTQTQINSLGQTLTRRIETAESEIIQNADRIATKVSRDGVISSINQTPETVQIDASRINLNGVVTISDFNSDAQSTLVTSVSTKTQYYLSSSDSSATGGTWYDSPNSFTWTSGKYVWTKTVTTKTFADNTTSVTESSAVYDKSLTTALSTSATAVSNAATAQSTANSGIKSSVMIWFTKANATAPSKPTAQVTTNNASTANAWNLAVPTYNSSYPYYFYCYQQQKGDNTYQWTDVVYDRATTETQSTSRAASSSIASYILSNDQAIIDLQNQIDGAVDIWYGTETPTTSNTPASSWTTTADKDIHVGDMYINTSNGHTYRFTKSGTTYAWTQVPESDAAAALAAAQDAQATADGKRRVFTTTPTVPYDVGDLWVNGSVVKYANTGRLATMRFTETDWTTTATDDTAAAAAQSTANSKRRIFTTATNPEPPYDVGDLWVNGSVVKYANRARAANASYASSDWTITATDDTTANSAVGRTQTIYIQAVSGTNVMAAKTTWVTATGESVTDDTTGQTPAWTTKRPTYRSNYPVLFVATQSQTMEQVENSSTECSCTTPLKDDTTTIIDGGHITTGSIDASSVAVTNINASNINTGTLTCSGDGTNGVALTATSGSIGGWTIDSTAIYSGDAVTSNSSGAVALSTSDFTRTINNSSREHLRLAVGSKFGVTSDGTVYASDGNFSGTVNATSGYIGQANITSDGISVYAARARSDNTWEKISKSQYDTPDTSEYDLFVKMYFGAPKQTSFDIRLWNDDSTYHVDGNFVPLFTYKVNSETEYTGLTIGESGRIYGGNSYFEWVNSSLLRGYTLNIGGYGTVHSSRGLSEGDFLANNILYYGSSCQQFSDVSLKENISYNLAKYKAVFDAIKPVAFSFKEGDAKQHLGYIAQEVISAVETAGLDPDNISFIGKIPKEDAQSENDFDYTLDYTQLAVLGMAVTQEQGTLIENLQTAFNSTYNRLLDLQDKFAESQTTISSLQDTITASQSTIQTLQSALTDKDAQIAAMQSTISTLTGWKDGIVNKLKKLFPLQNWD